MGLGLRTDKQALQRENKAVIKTGWSLRNDLRSRFCTGKVAESPYDGELDSPDWTYSPFRGLFRIVASVHLHPKSAYWQANFKAWDERRGWVRKVASTQVSITQPKARAQLVADRLEEAAAALGPESSQRHDRQFFARLVDELCTMAGCQGSSPRVTWARWREVWEKEQNVEESTLRSYRDGLTLFELCAPQVVDQPLEAITYEVLQRYYRRLQAEGLAPATVKLRWSTLRRCLERARVLGYLDRNPCALVKPDRRAVDQLGREPFTIDEARAILRVAEGEWRTACLFGYYYGMRIGDASSRRWEEIAGDELIFTQQKKRGRKVKLPLVRPMAEHLATQPRESEFITPHLAAITHNSQNDYFSKIMKLAGVEIRYEKGHGRGKGRRNKSFHSWRHTNKTMLIAAGVAERVADLINDHESPEMGRRYTHAEVSTMAEAIGRLPEL